MIKEINQWFFNLFNPNYFKHFIYIHEIVFIVFRKWWASTTPIFAHLHTLMTNSIANSQSCLVLIYHIFQIFVKWGWILTTLTSQKQQLVFAPTHLQWQVHQDKTLWTCAEPLQEHTVSTKNYIIKNVEMFVSFTIFWQLYPLVCTYTT